GGVDEPHRFALAGHLADMIAAEPEGRHHDASGTERPQGNLFLVHRFFSAFRLCSTIARLKGGGGMRGNDRVIAELNEALREELTAINQYFLHAEMCHNWAITRSGRTSARRRSPKRKKAGSGA